MLNRSGMCLESAQMAMTGSRVEIILWTYFLPPVLVIGIVGNLLTLMVLLSKEMRSKANILLAALSFFGTICLFLLIPHSMASIEFFNGMRNFRLIYFNIRVYLITLANWSSAVVSWLVVAVCAERLIGIRNPFHARQEFKVRNTAMMIGIIITVAGCLTFYHQYQFPCVIRFFCRDTQIISRCYDITKDSWYGNQTNPTAPWFKEYIRWSVIANAVFIVIVPNIALIFLNSALICTMKRRGILNNSPSSVALVKTTETSTFTNDIGCIPAKKLANDQSKNNVSYSSADSSTTEDQQPRITSNASGTIKNGNVIIIRRNISQKAQRTEQKMAITVCAIVSCFTVTQGPSAIVLAVSMLSGAGSHWHTAKIVTTLLTVIGISINFFLFCLISSNFRRKLTTMLAGYMRKRKSNRINYRKLTMKGKQKCSLYQ